MEENKNLKIVSENFGKKNSEDLQKQVKELQEQNDQLKNYCNQLMQQRNQVAQQLNAVQNVLNKLPWLFKVVEFSKMFGAEFTTACVEEIKAIMTPPAEDKEEEESPQTESEK